MSAFKLRCGFQTYDWGKPADTSLVAALSIAAGGDLSNEIAKGSHFAELWIGTHPSCPATVVGATGEGNTKLSEFLSSSEERKKAFFSPAHQLSAFRNEVPFLLKVLSIGKALSIQAHPNKALAEALHKKDPKNYKDPNHKPELIVALTPFEGLCCFRKLSAVVAFAKSIPSLYSLIGGILPSTPVESAEKEASILRATMTKIYKTDPEVIRDSLRAHQAALQQRSSPSTLAPEDLVFLRTMTEFPDDVGCWMVYILNLVKLAPGEGLFLKDSEPHAYLKGDGVEIMATSDNVVRAGLTPKFIDVDTLLTMLTYDTNGLDVAFRAAPAGTAVLHRYVPSGNVADFSLYRIRPEKRPVTFDMPTVGLGICVAGEANVNGVRVKRGETFVVTPSVSVESVEGVTGGADIFVASTNDFQPQSQSSL